MKFITQQGFSILQGLILSALLAGSALVTSKLVSDQKKVAISAKSKDAADEMTDLLYNLLQYQDNCAATLIQNGATSLTGTIPLNNGIYNAIRSPSDAGLPPQLVITTNTPYLQNSISISSLRIEYAPNLANRTPAILVVNMRRNDSKDSNLRTKDGFGGKDLTRRINIIIQRNEGPLNFKSCYAVKTDIEEGPGNGNNALLERFCNNELAPAFYWNSTTNTCEVSNNTCPPEYLFAGITSAGTAANWNGSIITSAALGAANCRYVRHAFRLSDFINNAGAVNCNGRPMVRWVKVPGTNEVQIGCN